MKKGRVLEVGIILLSSYHGHCKVYDVLSNLPRTYEVGMYLVNGFGS